MFFFLVWRSFFLENTSKAEARILKRRFTKWVLRFYCCTNLNTYYINPTQHRRSCRSSLFHSASSNSPHDVSNCSCWRHPTCLWVSLSSPASLLFSIFPICAQSSSFSHLFFQGFIFISNLATFVFVTSVQVGRRLRRDWIGVICYRWESDSLQTSHRPIEFLAFKNFPLISEWLHYFFAVECRPHARCVPQKHSISMQFSVCKTMFLRRVIFHQQQLLCVCLFMFVRGVVRMATSLRQTAAVTRQCAVRLRNTIKKNLSLL